MRTFNSRYLNSGYSWSLVSGAQVNLTYSYLSAPQAPSYYLDGSGNSIEGYAPFLALPPGEASPSQIAAKEAPIGRSFRVGGMVEKGSLERGKDGLSVRFVVTDTVKSVPVVYSGILPDLFKEGKGVVAQGHMETNGVFRAEEVLAKHDENYMPPEAAHALEQAQAQSTTTLK